MKIVIYPTIGNKCKPQYRGGQDKTKALIARAMMNIGSLNDKPRILMIYEK